MAASVSIGNRSPRDLQDLGKLGLAHGEFELNLDFANSITWAVSRIQAQTRWPTDGPPTNPDKCLSRTDRDPTAVVKVARKVPAHRGPRSGQKRILPESLGAREAKQLGSVGRSWPTRWSAIA